MQTALDRPATAERLRELRAEVSPETLARALDAASVSPPPAAWAVFLDRLTLALGAALIAVGALYFFAWNWDGLGRVAKLSMPLVGIAVAAATAWRAGLDRPAGRAALAVASTFVGVSLATHGQVYQTGADNWENFALWALLILPWTLAARGQLQTALWLVVAELGLGLWWLQEHPSWDENWLLFALFGVTAFAWGIRELSHVDSDGRWLPRVLFSWASLSLLLPSLSQIFAPELSPLGVAALVSLAAGGVVGLWFGPRRDLFLSAAVLGAWIGALSAASSRLLFDVFELRIWGSMFLSLLVIFQATLSARWLRSQARRSQEAT